MNKKKMSPKQIGAILCVVLLISLYVMTFVFALTDNPNSMHLFGMSIVLTVIIPVFAYVYTMLYKLSKDRREYNDTVTSGPAADQKKSDSNK